MTRKLYYDKTASFHAFEFTGDNTAATAEFLKDTEWRLQCTFYEDKGIFWSLCMKGYNSTKPLEVGYVIVLRGVKKVVNIYPAFNDDWAEVS